MFCTYIVKIVFDIFLKIMRKSAAVEGEIFYDKEEHVSRLENKAFANTNQILTSNVSVPWHKTSLKKTF